MGTEATNLYETGPSGSTPLYLASVRGDAQSVRALLGAGADPDQESGADDEGLPLCAAASWGHTETVEALLSAGADPDLREDAGRSAMAALHWAASGVHPGVVTALLTRGADPDVADGRGRTALSHAAERGTAEIVRLLLTHGADPHRTDDAGRAPIDLARTLAGRDLAADLRHDAEAAAPAGSSITVRHEPNVITVETRAPDGSLRSERFLHTAHAAIVRLLEQSPS
ncbi:ankyrin repeat domain-containing protein [Spongiactinospora sp. TRM90649]|uniref:ankyrin repeat domain-containing protein n=1 Tax=Spongiactinospora sp. TRM90649 TaxID=3031114 RepID=UPI0023F6D230|nr:ankyrin repeat domain-containing protein [Spongiactinospora sp. TRM90649]MDF5758898.1 ankyrin repeat domain-containing protein [Spongiactinospora sp. TRM90649]